MLRPFHAVGLLYRHDDGRLTTFQGSCFAFRHSTHFITAAHCVDSLDWPDLAIGVPIFSGKTALQVLDIRKHPTADLAILETDDRAKDAMSPFTHIDTIVDWGEPIGALGFPEESRPDNTVRPQARFFRGFVQRIFGYEQIPWSYEALELSFGAPGGLSGGPVFPMRDIGSVAGVAAANHSASTYLAAITDVQDGTMKYSERIHNMIEYGIAVRLQDHVEWIDSAIPAR